MEYIKKIISNFKKYAIFGLKEIQEFLECMEELKIPISRHKVAPIDL